MSLSASPPSARRRRSELRPLALRGTFVAYVGALVLLPLLALVVRGLSDGLGTVVDTLADRTAWDALVLSISTGLAAALVNALAGTTIAWMLVRWDFRGRTVLSWLVDLPVAIPTLVAGILIVALYGPQSFVGQRLGGLGVEVVFAKPGILLALLFVTLPFVVRTVVPIVAELDAAEEEAAATLGANRWQTFRHVLLPPILPAVAAGAVQTFARCLAEFGSVAVVSGNIPRHTLTAPVWIQGEVEAGNSTGAVALSLVLLSLALVLHPVSAFLVRSAGHRHV